MNRGVLYVAVGESCVGEMLVSAASLKRHMPDLPVTAFTDRHVSAPEIDRVVQIEADPSFPGCGIKIPSLASSPYEETLFLDSDTFVCGPLDAVFELLSVFDMAMAHAPTHITNEIEGVPDTFPELNSGVMAFRRSSAVQDCFRQWADVFRDMQAALKRGDLRWRVGADEIFHPLGDQAVLRLPLYRSRVRIATLPPEYNCRFTVPGFVEGPVRILHGRAPHLERVAEDINRVLIRRGYEERGGRIRLSTYPRATTNTYSLANLRYTLHRRGVVWTLRAAWTRLARLRWAR